MLKKLAVLTFAALSGAVLFSNHLPSSSAQDTLAAYRGNNCVACHSKTTSLQMDNRFFQWHSSLHRDKGVGCDKCHGGDPSITDPKKAHVGMLKPEDPKSKLHPRNLPGTCGSCHKEVVGSFVESKHYQKLKASDAGPSCSTCHVHMGSDVVLIPAQTAQLCATCHNSANKMLPKRPEIPGKASQVMQAIKRANSVVVWADLLIVDGKHKQVDVSREEQEMQSVHLMLSQAKTSWHAFNLEAVSKKADAAFEEGTKVKEALRKKLYPEP